MVSNGRLWQQCWATACGTLGLSAAEFYRLTPRQFNLLTEAHRRRIEHEELLAGIIASTVANWSQYAPKKATRPMDFMPSKMSLRDKEKPKRINRRHIADHVRSFMTAFQQVQR